MPSKPKAVKRVADVDKSVTESPAVTSLLQRAQSQQQQGNVQTATATLERAIRLSPRYPNSYYQLATLCQQQGQRQQASALAQKSISLGASGQLLSQAQKLLATNR